MFCGTTKRAEKKGQSAVLEDELTAAAAAFAALDVLSRLECERRVAEARGACEVASEAAHLALVEQYEEERDEVATELEATKGKAEEALKKTIKRMDAANRTKTQQAAEVRARLEEVEEQVEAAQEQAEAAKEAADAAEERLTKATAQLKRQTAEFGRLGEEMETERAAHAEALEALERDHAAKEKAVREAFEGAAASSETLRLEVKEEVEAARERIAAVESAGATLSTKLKTALQKTADLETARASLEAERDAWKGKFEEQEAEVEAMREAERRKGVERAKLSMKFKQVSNLKSVLAGELDELTEVFEESETNFDEAKIKFEEMRKKRLARAVERHQLENLSTDMAEKARKLEARVEASEEKAAAYEGLAKDLKGLQAAHRVVLDQRDALEKSAAALTDQLATTTGDRDALQKDVDAASSKLAESKDRLAASNVELFDERDRHTTLRNEHDGLKASRASIQKAFLAAQKDIRELTEYAQRLESEFAKSDDAKKKLAKDHADLTEVKAELDLKHEIITEKVRACQRQLLFVTRSALRPVVAERCEKYYLNEDLFSGQRADEHKLRIPRVVVADGKALNDDDPPSPLRGGTASLAKAKISFDDGVFAGKTSSGGGGSGGGGGPEDEDGPLFNDDDNDDEALPGVDHHHHPDHFKGGLNAARQPLFPGKQQQQEPFAPTPTRPVEGAKKWKKQPSPYARKVHPPTRPATPAPLPQRTGKEPLDHDLPHPTYEWCDRRPATAPRAQQTTAAQ